MQLCRHASACGYGFTSAATATHSETAGSRQAANTYDESQHSKAELYLPSGFIPLNNSKNELSVERIIWLSVLIDFS
jgi:hypothetical protein